MSVGAIVGLVLLLVAVAVYFWAAIEFVVHETRGVDERVAEWRGER